MAQRVQIEISADASQADAVISRLNANLGNIGQAAFKPQIDAVNKLSAGMLAAVQASDQLVRTGYRLTLGLSGPLIAAATYITKLGAEVESARVSFEVLTGSIDIARDHLNDLKTFAQSKPFDFTELLSVSRYLQAAGFSVQQVVPLLNSLGNALAAVGNSSALDKVVLQLVHIENLGRVTLRELNPIARAGIPVFALLAEAIAKPGEAADKTAIRLRNLLKTSSIPSTEFINYFTAAVEARFPQGLEKASQTIKGQFTILENNVKIALANLGEALAPATIVLINLFTKIAQAINTFAVIFSSLPAPVRVVVGLFIALLAAIGPVVLAVGYLTRAFTSSIEVISKLATWLTTGTNVLKISTAASTAAAAAKETEVVASEKLTTALVAETAAKAVNAKVPVPTQYGLFPGSGASTNLGAASDTLAKAEAEHAAASNTIAKANAAILAEQALLKNLQNAKTATVDAEREVLRLQAEARFVANNVTGAPITSAFPPGDAAIAAASALERQRALTSAIEKQAINSQARINAQRAVISKAETKGTLAAETIAGAVSNLPHQQNLFAPEELQGFKLAGKEFATIGENAAASATKVATLGSQVLKFSVITGLVVAAVYELILTFQKLGNIINVIKDIDTQLDKLGIGFKNFSTFIKVGFDEGLKSVENFFINVVTLGQSQGFNSGSIIANAIVAGFKLSFEHLKHPISSFADDLEAGLIIIDDRLKAFQASHKEGFGNTFFGQFLSGLTNLSAASEEKANAAAEAKKKQAAIELNAAIQRRLAEQEYAKLLEYTDEAERNSREKALDLEGKQLGGLQLLNKELDKYADKLSTRVVKLPGEELPKEIHVLLNPQTQLNIIKGYLAEVHELQQKTQQELVQEAFKADDEIFKNRLAALNNYTKANVSALQVQNASELISAEDVIRQTTALENTAATERAQIEIEQANQAKNRRIEELDFQLKRTDAVKNYNETFKRAFDETKSTQYPQGNLTNALQLANQYFQENKKLNTQLQAEKEITERATADKIKAIDYERDLTIYENDLKFIRQRNEAYIKLQSEEQAAAYTSANKLIEFQKSVIQSREQTELQYLNFIQPISIQQTLQIEQQKAAIRQNAIQQNAAVELQAIQLATEEQVRVKRTELEKEISNTTEIEKRLDKIRESGAQDLSIVINKLYADLGNAQLQAELDRIKIVRDNATSIFDTLKRSSETFLDQVLSKSKSFGKAITDSIKSAFTTTLKEIASSQIAGGLTRLVTGQSVSFQNATTGSGPLGAFGGIFGKLGLGKAIIGPAQNPIPNTAQGPTLEQTAVIAAVVTNQYRDLAKAPKPNQLPIPNAPERPSGYVPSETSGTLQFLQDKFHGDIGNVRLENDAVPIVIKNLKAQVDAYKEANKGIVEKLQGISDEDEAIIEYLRKLSQTPEAPKPSITEDQTNKAYERFGIPRALLNKLPPPAPPGVPTPEQLSIGNFTASTNFVSKFADAITAKEGFYPGTIAFKNNNPGNLTFANQPGATPHGAGDFAAFETLQQGREALENQIRVNILRGLSLNEFFGGKTGVYPGYANRPSDNPVKYAEEVGSKLGIPVNVPIVDSLKSSADSINIGADKIKVAGDTFEKAITGLNITVPPPSQKEVVADVLGEKVEALKQAFGYGPTAQSRFTRTPIYTNTNPSVTGLKGEYFPDKKTIAVYDTSQATRLHEDTHALLDATHTIPEDLNKLLSPGVVKSADTILSSYFNAYKTASERQAEIIPRLVSGQGYSIGLTKEESESETRKLLETLRLQNNENSSKLADTLEKIARIGSQQDYFPVYKDRNKLLTSTPLDNLLSGGSLKEQSAIDFNAIVTLSKWATERMPESLGQKSSAQSLSVVLASDQVLSQTAVSKATQEAQVAASQNAPEGVSQIPTNIYSDTNLPTTTIPGVPTQSAASSGGFGNLLGPLSGVFGGARGGILSGAIAGVAAGGIRTLTQQSTDQVKKKVSDYFPGITLDNAAAQSISNIVNQKYGGNLQQGLRSKEVVDYLSSYAAANGQKFGSGGTDYGIVASDALKTAALPVAATAIPTLLQRFTNFGSNTNSGNTGTANFPSLQQLLGAPGGTASFSGQPISSGGFNLNSLLGSAGSPNGGLGSIFGNLFRSSSSSSILGPANGGILNAVPQAVTPIPGLVGVGATADGQLAQIVGQDSSGGIFGTVLTSGAKGGLSSLGGLGVGITGALGLSLLAPLLSSKTKPTIGTGISGVAGGALLGGSALVGLGSAGVLGAGVAGLSTASLAGFGGLIGGGAALTAFGLKKGGFIGLGADVAGGAIAGFGVAGPIGAIVGAGVGAALGTARLFYTTKVEQVQQQVKDTYNLKIDKNFAQSLLTIINQKYGGSISVGIRTKEVLDLLSLYAATTKQQFGIANKARSSTLIQTDNGLTQQAIYENNKALSFNGLSVYGGVATTQIQPAGRTATGEIAPYQQLPGNGTSYLPPSTSYVPGTVTPGSTPSQSGVPGGITVITENKLPDSAVGSYLDGRTIRTVSGNPAIVSDANTAALQGGLNRQTNARQLIKPSELLT